MANLRGKIADNLSGQVSDNLTRQVIKLPVMFRNEDGHGLVVFPDKLASPASPASPDIVTCLDDFGHGACDYNYILQETMPVKINDDLYDELVYKLNFHWSYKGMYRIVARRSDKMRQECLDQYYEIYLLQKLSGKRYIE